MSQSLFALHCLSVVPDHMSAEAQAFRAWEEAFHRAVDSGDPEHELEAIELKVQHDQALREAREAFRHRWDRGAR